MTKDRETKLESPGIYRHYKGGKYLLLFHAKVVHSAKSATLLYAQLSEHREVTVVVGTEEEPTVLLKRPHEAYPEGSIAAVYFSIKYQCFWVRPQKMWSEMVANHRGLYMNRFTLVEKA